jgi:hypothetical protein
MKTEAATCVVCGSPEVAEFLVLRDIPIACSVFQPSAEQARSMPAADIRLAHCRACDHIFNAAFQPELVIYDEGYENSLSHSARFRRYARELAETLVRRFLLYGKHVTEIGSGNGEFLRELCRLGENRGTGYDPSYVPNGNAAGSQSVEFVRELFEERHAASPTDFVCCRHVLEHIQRPRPFMNMVRRTNADVYFEVPDVRFTLRDGAIWDIIYPHVSYFSTRSLVRLFRDAGFDVKSVMSVYEGQFLGILSGATLARGYEAEAGSRDGEMACAVAGFAQRYQDAVEFWTAELGGRMARRQKTVVWGGGAKCVSFLHAIQGAGSIEYVVDLNPHKQGLYVPGSGARVVGPEFLKDYRPDVVIVANSIYRNEIERMLIEKDIRPRSVVSLTFAPAMTA